MFITVIYSLMYRSGSVSPKIRQFLIQTYSKILSLTDIQVRDYQHIRWNALTACVVIYVILLFEQNQCNA